MRAYFAGGGVFSQEHGTFSQQDLFLAFSLDKDWLQRTDFSLPPEDGNSGSEKPRPLNFLVPRQFNTFYYLSGIETPGAYLLVVKRRVGDAKTDNVVAKTPHEAIKKPEANGKSTNVLEVRVQADKVDYAVNGTVVGSTPKAGLTTDGIWGIRVNHLLDVTIDEIGVTR